MTFRLEQDFGGVRTIGRLRLSAFTGPELPVAAARSVPSDIVAILDTTATQRTEAQTKRLTEFYRAEDKHLERMRVDKANLEKTLRDLGEGRSLVMEELSQRLVKVHIAQFDQAITKKVEEDQVPIEDIAGLMTNLGTLGLVKLGYLRAPVSEQLLFERCGERAHKTPSGKPLMVNRDAATSTTHAS